MNALRLVTWPVAGMIALACPISVNAQTGIGSTNADRAAQVLEQARGTKDFMCELAIGSLGNRYGGWYWSNTPDAATGQGELLEWTSSRVEEPDAVPTLSSALSDPDPCVRRVAARLLGHVEHPRALEALVDLLGSRDASTRQMAAIGLGYQDQRVAVEGLVEALRDSDARVRAAAAWALGEIEDPRAIEALTFALREDADAAVRRQAARALGEMH